MRKLSDFPAPDDFEQDDILALDDDASDDAIERIIENNRAAYRRAWFKYIAEFES